MSFMHSGRVMSLAAVALGLSLSGVFAQDVAAAYRERYVLVGELLRARAVCAETKQEVQWLLESRALVGGPDLKTNWRSLDADVWMDEGARKLNDKVVTLGVPGACEFAKAEGERALKLAKEALPPPP